MRDKVCSEFIEEMQSTEIEPRIIVELMSLRLRECARKRRRYNSSKEGRSHLRGRNPMILVALRRLRCQHGGGRIRQHVQFFQIAE